MDKIYNLTAKDNVNDHSLTGKSGVALLHDISRNDRELEIDALVASGDCFTMLASALDQLTNEPYNADGELIKSQIEKYVRILLYLQKFFEIVPKPTEYRR